MGPLITIGLPIYKRLHYLKNVLNVIDRQDYPHIELLVSDNGVNGPKVRELVDRYYPKPYKFRQNSMTVSISTHFNQLISEASGKYFVMLADDDEITANYISTLVDQLERHPQALVAISMQETIDESGNVITRSNKTMPEILSGTDFIRAAWGTHELGHESFSTFLARTSDLSACGGFPDLWKGHGNDDALLVKLCLGSYVALNTQCSYRKRFDETSHGYAQPIRDLARGITDFLGFLNSDPALKEYARLHPVVWSESKRYLVDMAWKTYYYRWAGLYRNKLTAAQWFRAAFALPFIPDYYRAVRGVLIGSAVLSPIQKYLPAAYDFYRSAKSRYRGAGGVR